MSIIRFVNTDGLPAFLAYLSKDARVLAPVEKPADKKSVVFEEWTQGKPFTLEKATVPAKEAVLPQCETLLTYKRDKDPEDPSRVSLKLDDTPQAVPTVVFACRPCDARGYVTLDRPYLQGPMVDPYYKARREQLTVLTLTCPRGCSTCFCHWVGGGPSSPEGSDVLMTEVEGGIVLQGLTPRGDALLEGSGRLAWKYEGFSDLHIRARVGFPQNGGGRAGVFLGNLFCCLNYDTQRVELYQGSSLLGSYATSFSKTPDAQLHSDPTVYTIEMRKRGNRVRVYSGSSYTLRFTATVSATSGYAGIQADNEIVCDLLRAGDAWAYEPYECFDVVYPDGVRTSFGRIARSDVTWDEEFQIFTVNSDVDEGSTRSEDISLDYDFFHSHLLEISCGNDYTAKVIPRDINVWTARLFLGDADGFSILYYQDVDSLVYWANEAAYRWGLRGIAIWSLGQEDMRLWEVMPKQI